MFGFLKALFGTPKPKRKQRGRRATAKQLAYARKIGLSIPNNPTIRQLSKMLSDAERANPRLQRDREAANEQKRIEKFGSDLVAQEKRWDDLGNQQKWIAAVYRSGKSVKAGVLSIGGATISDRGKLKIELEVGKVTRDRYAGPLVETGRYIELDANNLLWSDVVSDFDVIDVARFEKTLAVAEKMAKRYGG